MLLPLEGLSFDDVLVVPQHSRIASRMDVSLHTRLFPGHPGERRLLIPVLSANMDTCTEFDMAMQMSELGGMGVLHRFMSLKKQLKVLREIKLAGECVATSLGVNTESYEALKALSCHKLAFRGWVLPDFIVIDVAHGDSRKVHEMVKEYTKTIEEGAPLPPLMVGNVATGAAIIDLVDEVGVESVDAVKVGVGPGSMCTTRIITGCGVPQLTAILDCADAIDSIESNTGKRLSLVADGGIRSSGDIVKALAAGADAVMIGGLFAGTKEAPGRVITVQGKPFKMYRGMASRDVYNSRNNKSCATPEGEGKLVPLGGTVGEVVRDLMGGLRSGMSYCGARTLAELRDNAQFIKVTPNSMAESLARF